MEGNARIEAQDTIDVDSRFQVMETIDCSDLGRTKGEVAINSIIRYVAQKDTIPLLDIHAAFDENGRSNLYQSDWHHPTEKGAVIIAETLYKYLQNDTIPY